MLRSWVGFVSGLWEMDVVYAYPARAVKAPRY